MTVWRPHLPKHKGLGLSIRMAFGLLLLATLTAPAPSQMEPGLNPVYQAKGSEGASEFGELGNLTLAANARILERGKGAAEHNALIPLSVEPLETMKAFRLSDDAGGAYDVALSCLAQAVYYEAAVEPVEGKRAVAQVVLNRVRHPAYPASVCGVVYEGWNKQVCQFSFTCDGSLRRSPLAEEWNQSLDVARSALAGHVERSVGSATHYHADYVLPRWAYTLGKVDQVGRHLFYRFPGRAGREQSFTARWTGRERKPEIDLARFDFVDAADPASVAYTGAGPEPVQDPTDRRAENDIGGRLDTSKDWRLAIPDPVNASAGYEASRQSQLSARTLALANEGTMSGGEAQ